MGASIGRYEVIEQLGMGGMATVYLATDPYMKREVAVKVMSPAVIGDPDFRARFKREAEIIAALEHACIVPVYDFGYDDDHPFIVMRRMTGGTLRQWITSNGPLDIREAAGIMERMADAFDDAHGRGIIHRDFKPHNILLDAKRQTFLADFGLVKIVTHRNAPSSSANFIAGTPEYISPEQIYSAGEIDHRVDVYAMGVTLWEMITGTTPYQDTETMRLMMKHIMEPVPMLTSVLPDAPSGLEAVIAQAMAKDPNDRFASAGDFSKALNATSGWWGTLERRATKKLGGDSNAFSFGAIKRGKLEKTQPPGGRLDEKSD